MTQAERQLENLARKRDKIRMMELLIQEHERQNAPDAIYIADLRKRLRSVRSQLAVLSTTEPVF